MKKVFNLFRIALTSALVLTVLACSGGTPSEPKEKISITYDYNYEGCPEATVVEQYKGKAFDLKVLEREGFLLTGYSNVPYTDEDFNASNPVYKINNKITLNENKTLYAVWVDKGSFITITYNSFDAYNNVFSEEVESGKPFYLKADPFTKKGYSIIGWSNASGAETYTANAQVTFYSDTNLYAEWQDNTLLGKVILHSNYGKDETKVRYYETADSSIHYLEDDIFVRDGYRIIGWSLDKNATGDLLSGNYIQPYSDFKNVDEKVLDYYCIWQKNTEYKITFHSDDNDSYGTPVTKTYTANESDTKCNIDYLYEADLFEREGYKVIGYKFIKSKNIWGTSINYYEIYNGNAHELKNDTHAYAIWGSEEDDDLFYSTFYINDSTANAENEKSVKHVYYSGKSCKLLKNKFEREGYRFAYWCDTRDGTGTKYNQMTTTSYKPDAVYYAIWEKLNPVVTYHYNVEGVTDKDTTQTFEIDGTQQPTLPRFERDLHNCLGFSKTPDGEPEYYFNTYIYLGIKDDLDLYACWQKYYEIKIYANYEGGPDEPFTFMLNPESSASFNIPDPEFLREGYVYARLNTEPDGSGTRYSIGNNSTYIEKNAVLYVMWEDPLTITYNPNYPEGCGLTAEPVIQNCAKGTYNDNLENPFETPEGYTFAGWSETASSKSVSSYGKPGNTLFSSITEDEVCYAIWIKDLTYTFKSNYPDASIPEETVTVTLKYGDEYTLKAFDEFDAPEGTKLWGYGTSKTMYANALRIGETIEAGFYDVTYYAYYKEPAVITFDSNFGSEEIEDYTLDLEPREYKDSFTFIEYPEEWANPDSKKKFYGWSIYEVDRTSTTYHQPGEETLAYGTDVYYAVWKDPYVLTFHNEFDDATEVNETYPKESYTFIDYPWEYDESKEFIGWSTVQGGTKPSYSAGASTTYINKNTDYYPVFRNKPVVRFHSNDTEDLSEEVIVSYTVEYDTSTTLTPEVFTREGYAFDGWYTSRTGSDGYNKDGVTVKLTKDIDYYAIWKPYPKVICHANYEGSEQEDFVQVLPYNESAVLNLDVVYTREGYEFAGWNSYASASSPYSYLYETGKTVTLKTDLNLYAVWYEKDVTLTIYDSDEEDAEYVTVKVSSKLPTTFAADWLPARDGSIVKKYNKKGSTLSYLVGAKSKITEDTEFYAEWTHNRTVTFNSNYTGGPEAVTQEIPEATDVYLNACTFTREGYSFYGWAEKANSISRKYKDGDKINIDKDVTLYAIWRKN